MKRICSLLVAGALVFPLVIPSAGAAEAAPATLEETAPAAAQAASSTPCGRMGRSSSPATPGTTPGRKTGPSPTICSTASAR